MTAAIQSDHCSSRVLRRAGHALLLSLCFSAAACEQSGAEEKSNNPGAQKAQTTETKTAHVMPSSAKPKAESHSGVAVGQPAPNFTLSNLEGQEVSLSQFLGSTVVLEWFNPDCPFVKASHGPGSLKGLAKKHSKDTVWLAINSGGEGKQGAGVEASKKGVGAFSLEHPVLLDTSGAVGKLYGAERTPHMFVIDPKGVLVYKGAIDNSPDGEGKSPAGGTLVNYVEGALTAIAEGKPVAPTETKAYGCSVKYGDS